MKVLKVLVTILSVCLPFFLITACGGGGGSTPPPPVTISITPSVTSANLAQPKSFTATVTGSSNKSVNWTVNGVPNGDSTVGTITGAPSGTVTYTAPLAIPDPPSVTITAAAQANPAKTANASCTIAAGGAGVNQANQTVPIKLGTSGGSNLDKTVSFCCGGTLGSLVTRNGTQYILSNNHVLARSDLGAVNDAIGQPGLIDTIPACSAGKTVANLSDWALLEETKISNGPPPVYKATADAALASVMSGQVDTSGSILQFGPVDAQGLAGSAPPANTTVVPAIGMTVAKSGRTTGLTCSAISEIDLAVLVDYSASCGSQATSFTAEFDHQIRIVSNTFSAGGDSGSLIVSAQTAEPVGLLFAGSDIDTVANPIQTVLGALPDSSNNVPTFVGGGTHTIPGCTGNSSQGGPINPSSAAVLRPTDDAVVRAAEAKHTHAASLMSDPAVIGVGVGAGDNPGEAAVVIFVEKGKPHGPIPASLDGVPTKVRVVNRFKARNLVCPATTNEASLPR